MFKLTVAVDEWGMILTEHGDLRPDVSCFVLCCGPCMVIQILSRCKPFSELSARDAQLVSHWRQRLRI